MSNKKIARITQAGFTVDQFLQVVPIGRTSLYGLIKSGGIRSVILCGRRIIPASEAERLLHQGIQK